MAAVAGEDTSHAYDPAAARTTSPTIMIMVHSGPTTVSADIAHMAAGVRSSPQRLRSTSSPCIGQAGASQRSAVRLQDGAARGYLEGGDAPAVRQHGEMHLAGPAAGTRRHSGSKRPARGT
jgi:hypothetical protein